MQSSVFTLPGHTVFSYSNVINSGSTVSVVPAARYRDTVVVNGNRKGNWIDPNPFTFTKREWVSGKVYRYALLGQYGKPATETLDGDSGSLEGPFYGGSFITPEWGFTDDRCMEKIFEQVRGQSDLIIDLAEGSQTIRMLKGTLSLKRFVGEFLTEFVTGRGKVARRTRATSGQRRLDYVTGKWLEHRYGWMPLVGSIYDAFDTLASSKIARYALVKGRSGRTLERFYQTGTSRETGITTYRGTLKYRSEVGIVFELDDQKKVYDWTALNPVRIVWELTPFSFVADWVVNISQQLELLENRWLFASKFRKGYRSRSYLETLEVDALTSRSRLRSYSSNGYLYDGEYYYLQVSKGKRRTTHLDREVLTSLPGPSGFRINVKLGAKRQLDAAALLHQVVARGLRTKP